MNFLYRDCWHRKEIRLFGFLLHVLHLLVRTFVCGIQENPVQRVQQFHLSHPKLMHVFQSETKKNQHTAWTPYGWVYFVCSKVLQACMRCGRAAWSMRHRGIDSRASVSDGDKPNWIFWASTFSNDCKWIAKIFLSLCFYRSKCHVNNSPCTLLLVPVRMEGWKKIEM